MWKRESVATHNVQGVGVDRWKHKCSGLILIFVMFLFCFRRNLSFCDMKGYIFVISFNFNDQVTDYVNNKRINLF